MRDTDPDSEEAQAAARQNDREVFALQMQAQQSQAESALCQVGHIVWMRHDLGLDGRCKRCGAGFGRDL